MRIRNLFAATCLLVAATGAYAAGDDNKWVFNTFYYDAQGHVVGRVHEGCYNDYTLMGTITDRFIVRSHPCLGSIPYCPSGFTSVYLDGVYTPVCFIASDPFLKDITCKPECISYLFGTCTPNCP